MALKRPIRSLRTVGGPVHSRKHPVSAPGVLLSENTKAGASAWLFVVVAGEFGYCDLAKWLLGARIIVGTVLVNEPSIKVSDSEKREPSMSFGVCIILVRRLRNPDHLRDKIV